MAMPHSSAAQTRESPGSGHAVTIRMYGQGVGDCFLLSFPRAGDDASDVHVVIDCGVVAGTPDDTERLNAIVTDIGKTTDNHIDLLVITHEHWDHLSGFLRAADAWSGIGIDQLWTAWTEREDEDGLPDVLKRILEKHRRALTSVADRAMRLGMMDRQQTTLSLLSFIMDTPPEGMSFSAAPIVSTIFTDLKKRFEDGKHEFLEPGEIRRVPGTEAHCYVLGPPRSDTRLRQTRPTKAKETYEATEDDRAKSIAEMDRENPLRAMESDRSRFQAFAMSLLGPSMISFDGGLAEPGDIPAEGENGLGRVEAARKAKQAAVMEWESYEQTFPLDRSFRVSLSDAELAGRAKPDQFPTLESYIDEVNYWRRIDLDWLGQAETLALQADHLTNNTSLVLAFELPGARRADRKILLFVGDAQVGNWLSWDDIERWTPVGDANGRSRQADMEELLSRVAFYKVGHHGSHNATLKARGVERMPEGAFTAFVPVSVPVAREVKGWEKMPLDELLNALSKRTGGRVILADGSVWKSAEKSASTVRPEEVTAVSNLTVSDKRLPEKRRKSRGEDQGQLLEGKVPLWVQISVPY